MGTPAATAAPRMMTPLEQLRSRVGIWLVRLRRRLPHLVWHGQEIDVVVTFKENRLQAVALRPGDNPAKATAQLYRGALPQVTQTLREIGISFDEGMGFDGRDWEWDFSLRGPISVRFKRVCRTPERRQ